MLIPARLLQKSPHFCLHLIAILVVGCFAACSSYRIPPNGYMVRGDDKFTSLDEKMTILLGSDFISNQHWQSTTSPFSKDKLSASQHKALKKLRYDKKSYNVVFASAFSEPFELIGVVNRSTNLDSLIMLSHLKINVTSEGKWFDETVSWGTRYIYHAVVPVKETLHAPKYLSLIFLTDDITRDRETMKSIVMANVVQYKSGWIFQTSKTTLDCNREDSRYYDYSIPKTLLNKKDYMLLTVSNPAQNHALTYYTLLHPGVGTGAFLLCPGNYIVEYTTLENEVVWSQTINVD